MRVIIVENENFMHYRIGGISTYLSGILSMNSKENISFICIGNGFDSAFKHVNVQYVSTGKGKISNRTFLLKLFFLNLKKYIDLDTIIHLQHPYLCLPFLRYRKNVKLLLSLHSRQPESFKDRRNQITGLLYHFITKLVIGKYDTIIAPNTDLLNYYQHNYNISNIKTIFLPAPIETDIFKPADKISMRLKLNIEQSCKLILYAGRLEKVKNLGMLIKSFKLLQYKLENMRLWIIGEGNEKQKLIELTKDIGLANINFKHTINHADLADVMNAADVFVLCSENESGPLVVKEALACNLSVVSTDVGDVAEVIKGLEGCFISGYDEKEFAECLRKAVEYDGIRKYREAVLGYGVEKFNERLMEVYERCLTK